MLFLDSGGALQLNYRSLRLADVLCVTTCPCGVRLPLSSTAWWGHAPNGAFHVALLQAQGWPCAPVSPSESAAALAGSLDDPIRALKTLPAEDHTGSTLRKPIRLRVMATAWIVHHCLIRRHGIASAVATPAALWGILGSGELSVSPFCQPSCLVKGCSRAQGSHHDPAEHAAVSDWQLWDYSSPSTGQLFAQALHALQLCTGST